eukprot:jgi/Mesvir1/17452/Mv08726-RA.1
MWADQGGRRGNGADRGAERGRGPGDGGQQPEDEEEVERRVRSIMDSYLATLCPQPVPRSTVGKGESAWWGGHRRPAMTDGEDRSPSPPKAKAKPKADASSVITKLRLDLVAQERTDLLATLEWLEEEDWKDLGVGLEDGAMTTARMQAEQTAMEAFKRGLKQREMEAQRYRHAQVKKERIWLAGSKDRIKGRDAAHERHLTLLAGSAASVPPSTDGLPGPERTPR